MDSETILNHSFQRGLFAVPLAHNWREFLLGKDRRPKYRDLPMVDLVQYWKDRWLNMRKRNEIATEQVRNFTTDQFNIVHTEIDHSL